MAGATKKKKRPKDERRVKSLSAGRPPLARPIRSLSRKTANKIINSHHQLEKRREQARARGDAAAVAALSAEIESVGGIVRYQQASLQGQRRDRGGDSSCVLMQWLGGSAAARNDSKTTVANKSAEESTDASPSLPPLAKPCARLLEVGALSTDNACSTSGYFASIERIDLHSQGPGIRQQDFLQRPLPKSSAERFDMISLSLVLNYVPRHVDRGTMLLRCLDFLHEPDTMSVEGKGGERNMAAEAVSPTATESSTTATAGRYFPSIFMVLPEACVTNSRYCTEEHLTSIMHDLGFDLLASKMSQKLAYYLWKRQRPRPDVILAHGKKEINPGVLRNNFSIVLQGLSASAD